MEEIVYNIYKTYEFDQGEIPETFEVPTFYDPHLNKIYQFAISFIVLDEDEYQMEGIDEELMDKLEQLIEKWDGKLPMTKGEKKEDMFIDYKVGVPFLDEDFIFALAECIDARKYRVIEDEMLEKMQPIESIQDIMPEIPPEEPSSQVIYDESTDGEVEGKNPEESPSEIPTE